MPDRGRSRIIMITGDHPMTAAATAERIGITGSHPEVVAADVLEQLDEKELPTSSERTRR